MPLRNLLHQRAIDKATANALLIAFSDGLLDLGISEDDPRAHLVAKAVIEAA